MAHLLQQSIWEYERLLRKSLAKNITENTLTTIYHKLNDIEDGIEYIIKNYDLDKRTTKILVPKWLEIKEKRF